MKKTMTKTILTLSGPDLDQELADELRKKFYDFMLDPTTDVMVFGATNADVTFTLHQVEVPLTPKKAEEPAPTPDVIQEPVPAADATQATQVAPLDPSLVDKTAAGP